MSDFPVTLGDGDDLALAAVLRAAHDAAGPDAVKVRISAGPCERCAQSVRRLTLTLSRSLLRSVPDEAGLRDALRAEVDRAHSSACGERRFYRLQSALIAWRDAGSSRCSTGCAYPGEESAPCCAYARLCEAAGIDTTATLDLARAAREYPTLKSYRARHRANEDALATARAFGYPVPERNPLRL